MRGKLVSQPTGMDGFFFFRLSSSDPPVATDAARVFCIPVLAPYDFAAAVDAATALFLRATNPSAATTTTTTATMTTATLQSVPQAPQP